MQDLNQIESFKTSYKRSGVNTIDLADPLELVTTGYEVWTRDISKVGVVIRRNPRLCYALNRVTGRYPADTKFTEIDEPMFFVKKTELATLKTVLEIKDRFWGK